mmetsp:Transcript_1768/g.2266  ORF Transcript_1768/g.2266 Transcript_1768/m.2266 type:complete len:128 (+) Transcript_1768:278-661(+)
MWKAKLAQSKIDIIVFSDTYRANFTEALLFEGQELLKKHRNKLNLLIYDPDKPGIGPTVISYILREGETTGIYSMGEFRNWETLQIVTGIVSARVNCFVCLLIIDVYLIFFPLYFTYFKTNTNKQSI